jgi:nickel-dependent lactate racemase
VTAPETTGVIGRGLADGFLDEHEIRRIVREASASMDVSGRRVLCLIPDGTRTMPMPLMFRLLREEIGSRAAAFDFLVALGTHMPMTDEQLGRLVGQPVDGGRAGATQIFNHHWEQPGTFVTLGMIPAAETAALTGGRLAEDVPVALNRLILDYDHLMVCGPVFPHEVVGFSGGSKYFFPGIGGPDIINFTHWLGALITNYEVIGSGYTPVRAVIDRAAAMIDRPISCLSLVVMHDGVAGLFFGTLDASWTAASSLSASRHIVWVDRPFRRVLSVMPEMYDDLWTAAKGMYKMEPAIADGGEVVIHAPHITEVSYTHGAIIDEVGYHCRDYFLAQPDRFARFPGGVLAHSTHVKGQGTYDAATGIERPRITVTLATGIPEERCRRINLGYLDPRAVKLDEWQGREAEGIVMIPRAGEMLYRARRPG